MDGLTTRFAKVEMPIRKPWRVACLNTCLPEMLNLTCDGSHSHVHCEGRETLYSQGYTSAICNVIHLAIAEDITRLRNRPAVPSAQVLSCSDSNRPDEPRAQVLSGIDCNSDSRVFTTPFGREGNNRCFVCVDIDILDCSRIASQGVETPSVPHPALCCPVAMSAAPASSGLEKCQGKRTSPEGPAAGDPAGAKPERRVAFAPDTRGGTEGNLEVPGQGSGKRLRIAPQHERISDLWLAHMKEFRNDKNRRPPSLLTASEKAAKCTRRAVTTANCILRGHKLPSGSMDLDIVF